jgi:hypothetical protein
LRLRGLPNAAPPPTPLTPTGTLVSDGQDVPRCKGHRSVLATHCCDRCGAHLCVTCVFDAVGGKHLCPSCAMNALRYVGPQRRKSIIWSYVLAVVATLGLGALMSGLLAEATGADPEAEFLLGIIVLAFVFVPSAVGMGISWGTMDRRFVNPVSLWIASIWNTLLCAAFVGLMILGSLTE